LKYEVQVMSSTNREGQRHTSDYYITPPYEVSHFLRNLKLVIPDILNNKISILDPCAGGDDYNEMSYPLALQLEGIKPEQITTVDSRFDSRASIKENYLFYVPCSMFDLIITNPPFNLAMEIITKAMTEVVNGGYVIMLLRLNFFGSVARFQFWQDNMPKYVFVHHRRISFTGGTTDSIEYMHAVWQIGYKNEFTKLKII